MKALMITAAMLLSAPAVAQTVPTAAHQEVVVVVTVPVPAGATRERIVAGMQATVPMYQRLPGLIRKYFTLSDDNKFGGVYLFRTRAEAQAWFSDAWRAKSLATYGATPSVTYYDAPILLDGPASR